MAEFAEYRDINNRLKKRFNLLRKPNLKEASESYRKLSQKLSPFPNYAGYCLYSAAKCEHQIVGSLKEQFNINHSSNSLISPNASAPPPPPSSTATAASNQKTNHALENLASEAIWTEFQTWLDSARTFREIDVVENDINGAISAYAHAIQTCPSPRILTLVLAELATLYIKHHRFYEAAEVYIEAGLYREAINCLLRGHFYQDAYHCYQELFKKQTNSENYSGFTDRKYSCDGKEKIDSNQVQTTSQQKSSILNLFKKKQQSTNDPSEKYKEPHQNQKTLPPLKHSLSPFDFSEKKLTIDDYINFFLLRLYLYDPVKYEYPSPIIPIPSQCAIENLNDDNNQEEFDAEIEGSQKHLQPFLLSAEQLSSPFLDMINSKWKDRSIDDVVELNHLLETLYLSYRNELRPSIDNEYSDFDFIQKQPPDADIVDDQKKEDAPVTKHSGSESEETDGADDTSSSGHGFASTRYDSKDSTSDEEQQKHHSTTSAVGGEPKSPALKLLETGELDDISERLKQLAKKMAHLHESSMDKKHQEIDDQENSTIEYRVKKKIDQMEAQWIKKNIDDAEGLCTGVGFMFDNDEELRQQIACRLYPLLNGNQIQLLYDILEEKD